MGEFSDRVERWKASGFEETFHGYDIHCHLHPGNNVEEAPELLLILHGYPTCSFDWATTLPLLPTCVPWLVFDMLGFGLSAKPTEHEYSLLFQADLAVHLALKHNTAKRKILLVGHDMGTSVCAEILARDVEGSLPKEFEISGCLLFNGNMVMDKSSLIWGQRLLRSPLGFLASRLTFSWIFKRSLGSVFSAGHPMSSEEGDDQWALLSTRGGYAINHKLIEYTRERVERKERWLGAVKEWKKGRLYFLWGMEDPVATAELQLTAWKELRPEDVEVLELKGLGHYPQIEDPKRFAQALKEILKVK